MMKLLALLALINPSLALSPLTPAYLFTNPPHTNSETGSSSGFKIPTSYESAVMGRRILALTPLGDLATTFPVQHKQQGAAPYAFERRPAGMEGQPIGLMDYIAECEGRGDPTLLAIKIATSFRNAEAGSNVSLSVRWTPPFKPAKRISVAGWVAGVLGWSGVDGDGDDDVPETVPYSAANLPRMSLQGYLEKIAPDETSHAELTRCFVGKHPDAKYWLPGNRIHASEWVRLVLTEVYWIGGFGDRAYIGWIPIEEWRSVTREEWEGIRLPGEKKGWKEWTVGGEL